MNSLSWRRNLYCAVLCVAQLLRFSSFIHGQQPQRTEQPMQSDAQAQKLSSQRDDGPRLDVPSLGPQSRYGELISAVGYFDACKTGKIQKLTNEVGIDWDLIMLKRVGLRVDEWTAAYNILVDAYGRQSELFRHRGDVYLHSNHREDRNWRPTAEELEKQNKLLSEIAMEVPATIIKLQQALGKDAFMKLDNNLCETHSVGASCKISPTPFPYQ